MKKSTDPRHKQRIRIIQELFAQSYIKQKSQENITKNILDKLKIIDEKIQNAAPEWPLKKISKVDLAILRLGIFELIIAKKTPPKVIIDEAVELAKEFGAERSAPFINGVLGTILKEKS